VIAGLFILAGLIAIALNAGLIGGLLIFAGLIYIFIKS